MKTKAPIFLFVFSLAPGFVYQFIQDDLRVNFRGSPDAQYFLGVAPNFLGALTVASALYVIFMEAAKRPPSTGLALVTAALSAFGLALWEYTQVFLPNGTFDPHDLIWTVIGVVAFIAAERLFFNKDR